MGHQISLPAAAEWPTPCRRLRPRSTTNGHSHSHEILCSVLEYINYLPCLEQSLLLQHFLCQEIFRNKYKTHQQQGVREISTTASVITQHNQFTHRFTSNEIIRLHQNRQKCNISHVVVMARQQQFRHLLCIVVGIPPHIAHCVLQRWRYRLRPRASTKSIRLWRRASKKINDDIMATTTYRSRNHYHYLDWAMRRFWIFLQNIVMYSSVMESGDLLRL